MIVRQIAERVGYTGRATAFLERSVTAYRRAWLTLLAGFVHPVLFLFAVGYGAGEGRNVMVGGQSVAYPAFVSSGLLAAAAWNGAIYDSTMHVFMRLRRTRLYEAVLTTSMGPSDIVLGEISWAVTRGALYAGPFAVLMKALGLMDSAHMSIWRIVLALPVISYSSACLGIMCATLLRSTRDFDVVQLLVNTSFFFSGIFSVKGVGGRFGSVLASILPLGHAVQVIRGLYLGVSMFQVALHLVCLLVIGMACKTVALARIAREN